MTEDERRKFVEEERARMAYHEASLPLGPPPGVELGPLGSIILKSFRFQAGQYPSSQVYADELEELLAFAQTQGVFDRYKPELTSQLPRFETALDEMRIAIHFVKMGFTIVEWEPKGAGNTKGEYRLRGTSGDEVFVEAKSPEWKGELTEEEIIRGRREQPKHLFGEVNAVATWQHIQSRIDKAYHKFDPNVPNLLVINGGRLRVDLALGAPMFAQSALYTPNSRPKPDNPFEREKAADSGYFLDDRYQNLGGVGIFGIDHNVN